MALVRYVKVTIRLDKNINACTVLKARTVVIATASYKNLLYTTNMVEDMGRNPAWENDGTNVFYFGFESESEYITLELFNRNKESVGVSKLLFSELGHLMPGISELKTLRVIEKRRPSGELVLAVEIMAQQAMGELGLLMVELRKGFIPNLTSILPLFGSKTTKIGAKLTFKHTTYESMGSKFVWHEDNTFTFIINSLKPDDILKVEVYNNKKDKVGECEILMSLFIEQEENPRGVPRGLISQDLCLPSRGSVGNMEVTACFIPKPVYLRSSFAQTQHPSVISHSYLQPQHQSTSAPYHPLAKICDYSPVFYSPSAELQFQPSVSFNHRTSAPSPQSFYPPVAGHVHLKSWVSNQTNLHCCSPSAPEYNPEVANHRSWGSSDTALDYQNVHGAPAGREKTQCLYKDPELDEEMKRFMESFH